ncbi:MAG TPA: FG-GAP-like repeat-containing protein, partial [Vicinamibacterales bacterium]|nr:FG-GAP-like repeat-containing protein [Vicinamibacterales bacterium]
MSRLVRIATSAVVAAIAIVFVTQLLHAQTSAPRPNVAVTRFPTLVYSVIPADVNGDGRVDLVGGYSDGVYGGTRNLRVKIGNGDGTFGADQMIAPGLRPLAVGDFNGDARPDILARDDNAIYVVPGHGDGTFDAPLVVDPNDPDTAFTYAVVGDFDGNGTLDFAKTGDDDALSIYPGNGDFTFGPPATFATDQYADGIVAADFNGDGRLDVAIPTRYAFTVDVFLNGGGLLFTTSVISLGRPALGITAADIDGDGARDLLVSVGTEDPQSQGFTDGFVYLLRNNGSGGFSFWKSFPTNNGPKTIVTGDFNRDGVLDIATGNVSRYYDSTCDGADSMNDSVSILPGLGSAQFGPPVSFALIPQTDDSTGNWMYRDWHHLLRTADVNGDGNADLIASSGAVLLNVPASSNHTPTATAGGSTGAPDGEAYLTSTANDVDNDWLTFEWKDASGTTVGTHPRACVFEQTGTGNHAFTLTVSDARGGRATSTWTVNFGGATTTSGDVGAVGASGSSSFDGTTYTETGDGADIWGTADAFHYDYRTMSGDFDVIARVASVQDVNRWTKGGIMIRENATDPGSRHVSLFATPTTEKGVALQWRSATGGESSSLAGPATAPPEWVRLVRYGDVINAYYRLMDTDAWTGLGSVTLTNLPTVVAVGLAISSHVNGTPATATFDHVSITGVTNALPYGWTSRDIGPVGAAGSATFADEVFTVKGSGADIWGTSDAFQYVATSQTGDHGFEITARVTSVENIDQWTKAGLMFRSSDSPSAAQASIFITPGKGIAFQRRKADGQASLNTSGPLITAPVWLKLMSVGSTVRAYYRTGDQMAWTLVGQDTISFDSTIAVGLAVTSHDDGALATATFDNVSVRTLVGWGNQYVGVNAGSDNDENGAVFDVTDTGADIWGTADQAHMITTEVSDGVSARVLGVTNTNAWTKAGVTIRDDVTAGARHVSLYVTPGKGIAMQYRATTNGTSSQVADIAGAAPHWIRLRRSGTTFIGEASADGISWTLVGQIDVTMNQNAVGGLIVTSHDSS